MSATASLKETESSLFLFKVNDVIRFSTSCKRLLEVRSKRRYHLRSRAFWKTKGLLATYASDWSKSRFLIGL